MGSGKSTVGQKVASRLSIPHVDLDKFIENQENCSISKIIAEKGAIYFRKKEREHLKSVLQRSESLVLSLGGGTPCYYDNIQMINNKDHVSTIYLRATVPFLTDRLFSEKSHRPIIAAIEDKTELAEFIGKHLLERSSFYSQANHQIDIQEKTPTDLVNEILDLA